MRKYIRECEDLNYKKIILSIDEMTIEELSLFKNMIHTKPFWINKEYRWEYVIEGNKLFYVENCDLQDIKNRYLIALLDEGYKVYILKHNDTGFYYTDFGDDEDYE